MSSASLRSAAFHGTAPFRWRQQGLAFWGSRGLNQAGSPCAPAAAAPGPEATRRLMGVAWPRGDAPCTSAAQRAQHGRRLLVRGIWLSAKA